MCEKNSIIIDQKVAILIDGNNIEKGLHDLLKSNKYMIDFDKLVPKLLKDRKLGRIIYFREGTHISKKLSERLNEKYFGTTVACYKSADISLTIEAIKLADKVDTVIICSGDADYLPLIDLLKMNGVRVEIASVRNCLNHFLLPKVDFIHYIEECDTWKVMTNEERFKSLGADKSEKVIIA